MTKDTIGDRLRQCRHEKGLTQEEVLEALRTRFNFAVARETLSKWENNKQEPSIFPVNCLAKIYNVTSDFLIDGEVAKPVAKEPENERITILARAARHMNVEDQVKLVEMAKLMFKKAFDEVEKEK